MFWCKRNDSGLVRIEHAEVSTFLIVCFGGPYGSELQKPNLEVMKACTNISAVWRLIWPYAANVLKVVQTFFG